METSVTLERAIELACRAPLTRNTERVSLADAADRILATDLASKVDDPRFDNSAMDGWAVRADDCASPGASLRIVGTSQAGTDQSLRVGEGEACRIMTGAPVPEGADAIVMIEDSTTDDGNAIVNGPARPGYIRRRGENLREGDTALLSGTQLTPAALSLAATMGFGEVEVVVKPNVAVISVGDELVPPGEPLGDGAIYESNTFGVASLVERMGGRAQRFEAIQDSMDDLRAALDEAAATCDAILTSGGVSMGQWDFVRRIMEEEGKPLFWRIRMRPGGPPLFGRWKGTPLFGLPGNPVSSHVVFTVLVSPWMSSCMGAHEELGPQLASRVRVVLENPLKGAPGKLCLRRISIRSEGDSLLASTHTHQGSGNIHSMVAHNGLSLLAPDTDANEGEAIDALWLR